jgi:hypothetical protein
MAKRFGRPRRVGTPPAARSSAGATSGEHLILATSPTTSRTCTGAASSGVAIHGLPRGAQRLAIAVAAMAGAGCATLSGRSDPVAQVVGEWRLDSLAFYAMRRDIPDSTRRLLERYRQTTRTASRQFRSGEVLITTRYRADSTYEHTVRTRDPAQRGYREEGRWRIERTRARLWCRNDAARPCPHDRAVVERVTDREMILHLQLTGRGSGLAEYFRLVRVR